MALLDWLFGVSSKNEVSKNIQKKIFISFAIEDKIYRDFLVDQANLKHSPFAFIDMSVKEKWDEDTWKEECRKKIRECDGVIVLMSKKTYHAGGVRWEMKCALEENILMIGIHIKKKPSERGAIPPELSDCDVYTWSWENLNEFMNKL